MGEAGMKVCESTRKSSEVRTKECSALIIMDMNGSGQTGKPVNELFIYIMTRRPVLPQQEDGNKDVTRAMLPSAVSPGRWRYTKRGVMDNRQQPCWRFMENKAFVDEMRIWHSLFIIQCRTLNQILESISLGVIVPVHLFWSFSPGLHYLFCFFSWNETQTKPACHSHCSADESLTHSMALSS